MYRPGIWVTLMVASDNRDMPPNKDYDTDLCCIIICGMRLNLLIAVFFLFVTYALLVSWNHFILEVILYGIWFHY